MISAEVINIARMLQLKARKRASEARGGAYLSAFRGEGLDFRDVREYFPGDEVRRIDWNVSARTGKTHIKTFHEDKNIQLIVAVDLSASMDFGTGDKSKAEVAAEIASLILLVGSINRHKTSLLAFSEKIEFFQPLRSGKSDVISALTKLIEKKPEHTGTDFDQAGFFIEKIFKKRAVLCLVSDFHGLANLDILLRLKSRFKLNLFQVYDEYEKKKLPFRGSSSLLLRDLESGRYVQAGAQRTPKFNTEIKRHFPIDTMQVEAGAFKLIDVLHFFNRQKFIHHSIA